MASKKIVVFLGTTRDGRLGDKVANHVKKVLDNIGMSAKLFGVQLLTFIFKCHY